MPPCVCCEPAGCKPAAAQKPYGHIILLLALSYYTLFLSKALLLQVEHPVHAATHFPPLSPAGREHWQNRSSAQFVGVNGCTLEVPTCNCVPMVDLRSEDTSEPHTLVLNKQHQQISCWQTALTSLYSSQWSLHHCRLMCGLQFPELKLVLIRVLLWAQLRPWLPSKRIYFFIYYTNGAAQPFLKVSFLSSNVQGVPITEKWKFLQNRGKYGPGSSVLIWPAMIEVWKAGMAETGFLSSGFLTNSSVAK